MATVTSSSCYKLQNLTLGFSWLFWRRQKAGVTHPANQTGFLIQVTILWIIHKKFHIYCLWVLHLFILPCFLKLTSFQNNLHIKKSLRMSGYKKLAAKKDICLHLSFKTVAFKKVSFYQACPKQTLKKTDHNNSLLHSAYSLVNEGSLYLFCSGLQQLSMLGHSNEACH